MSLIRLLLSEKIFQSFRMSCSSSRCTLQGAPKKMSFRISLDCLLMSLSCYLHLVSQQERDISTEQTIKRNSKTHFFGNTLFEVPWFRYPIILGFNEPNHKDQSDLSPEVAAAAWIEIQVDLTSVLEAAFRREHQQLLGVQG